MIDDDSSKGGQKKILVLGWYQLLIPLFFWAVALFAISDALLFWIRGESRYEQNILKEWLEEARIFRKSLPELIDNYQKLIGRENTSQDRFQDGLSQMILVRREEIYQHLRALGEPPTKIYPDILPLFPTFYEIEITIADELDRPIRWSSGFPFQPQQCQVLDYSITENARVKLYYQLHAYDRRRSLEQEKYSRGRWLFLVGSGLAMAVTIQSLLSFFRERRRVLQSESARRAASIAEKEMLAQQLVAKAAEESARRAASIAEKEMLAQQLVAKAAEKDAIELRSQMYAGVGIMAGSYAHNIKNLLVRPLDLLRRCVGNKELDASTATMLGEVEVTLGAVSDRLEQILRTVRRQDDKFEPVRIDLRDLVLKTIASWKNLADDKWKIDLEIDEQAFCQEAFIKADPSLLQQILENLIFNARDAIFEQRIALREQARSGQTQDIQKAKITILEAAAWRGRISFVFSSHAGDIFLEVRDNGAGMTPEVIARCTEAYFSTRRESAIFGGLGSGMGLGLSFVQSVLDKSGGKMTVISQKGFGTTFKLQFETV